MQRIPWHLPESVLQAGNNDAALHCRPALLSSHCAT
jgi:hypothetical protein